MHMKCWCLGVKPCPGTAQVLSLLAPLIGVVLCPVPYLIDLYCMHPRPPFPIMAWHTAMPCALTLRKEGQMGFINPSVDPSNAVGCAHICMAHTYAFYSITKEYYTRSTLKFTGWWSQLFYLEVCKNANESRTS